MASETERTILDQDILRPVGKTPLCSSAEQELIGFLAMEGNRYTRKLMVVGRAVNGGFADSIALSALVSPSECASHSRDVLKKSNGDGGCPMQWVDEGWGNTRNGEYNLKRSAFWRVIRQVVERVGIVEAEDSQWYSHLVWSNLCKVSPEKGNNGRPSNRLYDAQLPGCKKLLDHEIETYKPERLLFLTGWDWAGDFLSERDIQPFDGKGFVERSGSPALSPDTRTRVLVAVHPGGLRHQGKQEADWVDEVVSLLV